MGQSGPGRLVPTEQVAIAWYPGRNAGKLLGTGSDLTRRD